ncbi:MAG TPA: iron-containing redox enzyme family protein [Nocardioides sp.]|uniref:iron-containing redox enzyme family protein n=1 Tax=Nocardioides sp. TaxID=35761 RepID=UPI002F3FBD43
MKLPEPCGPVSRRVGEALRAEERGRCHVVLPDEPVLTDRDVQLALWTVYELSYRGFDDVDPAAESDPDVVRIRGVIEHRFEQELRQETRTRLAGVPDRDDVADQLLTLVRQEDGPKLSSYLRREATLEEMRDYLRERSVQQLRESDPQSFLLPRLEGAAKVALAELQYDEYGAGRPERLHQTLYAEALAAVGLDDRYAAYVGEISGTALASANVMSLFALNRRGLAAGLGHFAVFEASSVVPSRRIASGIERLELPAAVATYFLEHVEADAVHEQVAARDVCGPYVADHPDQREAVLFGAACALHLDELSGRELLARWAAAAEVAS